MKIERLLVEWYSKNKRDLPFRLNQDPYRVWISEMMAQQTQIETLLPYYTRWMKTFPTLEACARAQETDILQAWAGLGYYSRARNIHKTAQIIYHDYHGQFPNSAQQLQKLPGIGPYSAAAIASICFQENVAAIDGNVKRVLSRLFLWDETLLKRSFETNLRNIISQWMHTENPSDVTQAIMELGALVCTKQARCQICPLMNHCEAYKTSQVQNYPKVITKKAKSTESIEVVYLMHTDQTIAFTNQNSDKLMQGYYRLPTRSQITVEMNELKFINQSQHVFSHKIWNLKFYMASCTKKDASLVWIRKDQINELPIITAHLKWLNEKALHLQLSL